MKKRNQILPVQNEAGALTGETKLLLEEVWLEDLLEVIKLRKLKKHQSRTVQWKRKQKALKAPFGDFEFGIAVLAWVLYEVGEECSAPRGVSCWQFLYPVIGCWSQLLRLNHKGVSGGGDRKP